MNDNEHEELKKIVLDLRKDFQDLKKIIHEEILDLEENSKDEIKEREDKNE